MEQLERDMVRKGEPRRHSCVAKKKNAHTPCSFDRRLMLISSEGKNIVN
jgi:hypothetical protein